MLSDIHANVEALEACLKHALDGGATRFAFLGDFVGYGADPAAVVAIIMRHAAQGAVVIKGNHEDAIERRAGYMNAALRESIDLAREQLSAEQKSYLAQLPLSTHESGMGFVHASAAAPGRWEYVDSPAAALRSLSSSGHAYTFSGHVHDQILFGQVSARRVAEFRPVSGSPVAIGRHRRWLALVGSVGQPRDGRPAAAYTMFDPGSERITFFRVPYDHLAAARKIRAAGLPEALAYRVQKGI